MSTSETPPPLPTPFWRDDAVALYQGHVVDLLDRLPAASVQCCLTSPPYFGLRSYGTVGQVWGGDPACPHAWSSGVKKGRTGGTVSSKVRTKGSENFQVAPDSACATCAACGAWRGELGGEILPDCGLAWHADRCDACYICHLLDVLRAVRRVLRPDGLLWLNLGSSYAGSWGNYAPGGITGEQRPRTREGARWERKAYADTTVLPATAHVPGYPDKSLIPVPWLAGIALQRDGWLLRSDVIWKKENAMPGSARDRPTPCHEYVLLLARQGTYYYDGDAIKERAVSTHPSGNGYARPEQVVRGGRGQERGWTPEGAGGWRTARSVWDVNTTGLREAHFATWPLELARRCVLAGSRPGDVVLDPFAGSGTTGLSARRLGRRAVLLELKPEYCAIAAKRLENNTGMPFDREDEDEAGPGDAPLPFPARRALPAAGDADEREAREAHGAGV